jgi:hypothetical protein
VNRVTPTPRLGLRENIGQFALLVLVNAFVGGMVGIERSILPAIAEQEFHLAARAAALSFIAAFGIAKALTNYAAGSLSDRIGRRPRLDRRMAARDPSAVPLDVGAELDVDCDRQRAPWCQPGPDLVHHGDHEDRSRRAAPARPGHGP